MKEILYFNVKTKCFLLPIENKCNTHSSVYAFITTEIKCNTVNNIQIDVVVVVVVVRPVIKAAAMAPPIDNAVSKQQRVHKHKHGQE